MKVFSRRVIIMVNTSTRNFLEFTTLVVLYRALNDELFFLLKKKGKIIIIKC